MLIWFRMPHSSFILKKTMTMFENWSQHSLADSNLNRWATNWAFFIASWVSSSLMPRCHTALTEPPTWGNMSTRTPWSRASTSSSLTSSISSQKRVGLSSGTRKQKRTMLVSTEAMSTWYKGGLHSVRAVRKSIEFILDTSKGMFYADVLCDIFLHDIGLYIYLTV